MGEIFHLFRVWRRVAKMVVLPDLLQTASGLLFIVGKLVRFALFFFFIFAVVQKTNSLAGYSPAQIILFFLIFTLIDAVLQFFFRGVYYFRPLVLLGNFDLDLLKPLPSFFRPLFGHPDFLDLVTLFPFTGVIIWFICKNNLWGGWSALAIFFLLFLGSLLLGFAFHLFTCSICLLTTNIDHLIWVYRDLVGMGKFPVDIYRGVVRFLLTFVFPVALLVTLPAKGLLGLVSWPVAWGGLAVGALLAFLSWRFWHFALHRYESGGG